MTINQQMYAFPFKTEMTAYTGMTQRDWLAGLAMQGLVAKESTLEVTYQCEALRNDIENLVAISYDIADAMIKGEDR
jgi:hypothetical protein|tara:strand:- start:803 stop:1033 length:231 start_codon:yes stop_codon:yes gene_type:complete